MKPIIEVINISKKYNINRQRGQYVALRDVLTNIIKKPFTFLKEKVKEGINKGKKEEYWALKNLNFTVKKGEVVGIIGQNGAGKSTILKILSQITPPTTGKIIIRGKIASLLEVGTGFHPELSGRENIFLNGAIIGMTKKEIEKKFDEIVKFAGIEKFIDTPVKKYSSGMHVRLAFSVAAHMEPDILLVDEVLAVGDAEFQKKCLGKMNEVTKKSGRTIIFVSHDMNAIKKLCHKCILLKDGEIKMIGATDKVIEKYLKHNINNKNITEYKYNPTKDRLKNDTIELISAELLNDQNIHCAEFNATENINIIIKYKIKQEINDLFIDAYLYNEDNIYVLHTSSNDTDKELKNKQSPGLYTSQCTIDKNILNTGKYSITIGGRIPGTKQFFSARNALNFQITSIGINTGIDSKRTGIIAPILKWQTKNIK